MIAARCKILGICWQYTFKINYWLGDGRRLGLRDKGRERFRSERILYYCLVSQYYIILPSSFFENVIRLTIRIILLKHYVLLYFIKTSLNISRLNLTSSFDPKIFNLLSVDLKKMNSLKPKSDSWRLRH